MTPKANLRVFVDSSGWPSAFCSYRLPPAKAEEQRCLEGSAVKASDSTGHDHEWYEGADKEAWQTLSLQFSSHFNGMA